ncbi:unnamed protein product [Closterium sp. NIES-65]|nr:unnamed protein product [Closterium sp. NIES-65]
MHSRYLVSGLPRVLPPLPPLPAPPLLPCVEGWQRAAPHSSSFPPTEAPLQTFHLDVWGPARVWGQGHERYFLLVVDDYMRYTTVFPLRTKAYCAEHGIRQTFTLPASPQQNGVAERRIDLVMEVARTSMIFAAAPHFLWPFVVQYAAHQLNLWPRVSVPETSPTLRWTGEVGHASVFRVWGCRAFVRDTSADKLSSRAVPCVFLGFVPDAPGWQFYHPTSRRVFASQDVTFDEPVPFYRVPSVDRLPPQGAAPSCVSQVDPVEPVEVAVDSSLARGNARAEPGGAETGGAESGGAETAGAELGGAATGGAEPRGAKGGGSETDRTVPVGAPSSQQLHEWYSQRYSLRRGATGAGGSTGVGAGGPAGAVSQPEPPSPQRLREWYARRCTLRSGAPSVEVPPAGGSGATRGPGAAVGAAGAGAAGGPAGAAGGTGAAGGATGATRGSGAARGAAGAGSAGGSRAVFTASRGTSWPRPYFVPLLQQVLGQPPPPSPPPSLECPLPVQSQTQLPSASPLPGPSPYSGLTGGLTERREPESRPVLPVSRHVSPVSCPVSTVRAARTGRRVPRERPPPVPGTHYMTLRPSTAPQRVPLPSSPASSLPVLTDPESDSLRAASPTVTRRLATAVSDLSFESAATSALVVELVDFAARCRPDYAASLVAESESVCPPSVGDIPTPRSYAEAIAGEYSSQWQPAMDVEMASWKSTGTFVDEVPPPGANIVSGMWIFRVKRPPGSPPVFKARYVARGFSHREGVDFFQTFSPTRKMTTLRVLL